MTPPREAQYYIRMKIDGVWCFLWKLRRNKSPIWLEEATCGAQLPRLYKTLTMARNSLDLFVSAQAEDSQVAVWRGSDAHA